MDLIIDLGYQLIKVVNPWRERHMQPLSEDDKILLKNHFSQELKLSKREAEVGVLVFEGLTNREVANQLCVAEKTVKFHLTNIYKKLNISRRSQISRFLGWTLPHSDFIGGSKPPHASTFPKVSPAEQNPSAEEDKIIPAGCITVADQEQ